MNGATAVPLVTVTNAPTTAAMIRVGSSQNYFLRVLM